MGSQLTNVCLYRHIRLDTNKVFYIGIGSKKRAYKKLGRNIYWNNIVNKTNYEVQILKSNLTWEEACELEILLINFYGRVNNKTGILCNMTCGGEGQLGLSSTIETRNKISNFHKNRIVSNESKIKMKLAKEGMYLLETNPNAKKVINIETNEIFNTLKEACLKESMKYSTFKWAIKHKLNFKYKYYDGL